jgi:hypothetical protein
MSVPHFEDWFYSKIQDGYPMTAEQFYDDVLTEQDEMSKLSIMRDWLHIAFLAGQQSLKD